MLYNFSMESMQDLVGKYELPKKGKKTERGELLKYFSEKLHISIPLVAFRVTGLTVQDLYYIKSACDQAEARGVPWGATFTSSLKVQ